MARAWMAPMLIVAGIGVMAIGYAEPTIIARGARPYAYLSVLAVGAMLIIAGALLWRYR